MHNTNIISMRRAIARGLVLLTVILMDILGGAELDLFVPSFPELQAVFKLSPFWVEALLSVNFAGYCLGLLFVGGLADRYGRKPIILLGLIIFIFGSALCFWARVYPVLFVGRFLQGVGVTAPAALCFLIIADTYSLKKQQYLIAMLNGLTNTSIAIAPVIGSYVTIYFHWQGNFMTLLLLGIIIFTMTLVFIPNYRLPVNKEPISLKGYLPIFQSRPLVLLLTHLVFIFVPYWVFVGMAPILYMEDLGVDISRFGFYQGSLALIFAIGSVCFGLVMHKLNQKKLLWAATVGCAISLCIILSVALLDVRNPLYITLSLLPFTVGQIIPSTILYPVCLNFMPQAKGRVSAAIRGACLLLTAFGLEVAGYYYTGSFRNIGLILSTFILVGVVALVFVIRNERLMKFSEQVEVK